MRKLKLRLLTKLAAVFALAVAVGTTMLTVDNVFLNHIPLRRLLEFNIPAILAGDLFILIVLSVFSYRWIGSGDDPEDLRLRLMRLPGKMLSGLLLLSIALSALYDVASIRRRGGSVLELTASDWADLAGSFVSEMTVALVIGTLQYALSRRAVRPVLLSLGTKESRPAPLASLLLPMSVATLSCFFVVSTAGFEYLSGTSHRPIEIGNIAVAAAIRLAFGMTVFYLLVAEIRQDIRTASAEVKALQQGGGASAHRPIPVVSGDEFGELAEAFNRLQRHMGRSYEETRQELRLAYQVQKSLLPAAARSRGGLELAALSAPSREVGGDLFDIVERPDGGLVVMIGDVSGKGVSASMLMTATLALFRKEARAADSPAELLRRLNMAIAETLQGRMYVTMGVGFWDAASSSWRYASAGHVSPLLVRGRRAEEAKALPSLPLGIDAEEDYAETIERLEAGDALLLYTDGIVEATAEDGELFGFARLERALERISEGGSAEQALRRLIELLPPPGQGAYDDDRTLLLLRLPVAGEEADRIAGS
ncbi:PP2C family protein-serine/threonine phosphatase [Paenibacillus sp.]|uniref:PP2C family protein-serine/threonine phosphatase n=1 Tax=Paenibacillus sp. TaxID=58172 RepID=UPI00281225F2|nr:PP2C family protein-serine/threonine phosphatase [Paenibacillus sp.]